jgi:acetyltransferase
MASYEIPVPESRVVKSPQEASEAAKAIGFPVVAKIMSPDVLHKTEIKGYIPNIESEQDASKAYFRLLESIKEYNPEAKITGVLIEKMEHKKYELFFGCRKDPIFGPTIVFGMGGVAVEVFHDINIGLPPLNMVLAKRLIEETKIYKLLKGYRNMGSVDIASIQFILYKLAYLVIDFPQIKEVDINPFAVDEKGGIILDAKIILDTEVFKKPIIPYEHLVITPYPKQYITTFEMKDGKKVTLRPIRPEDEPMEAEMFTKFSKETQRFRFFSLINGVTHDMLVRYTQIDYDREMAIIAELDEDGRKKMLGVVRIIADFDHDRAEFALVVADPWQGLGLGSKLTDYILQIGKEKGLKKIYAYALEDNTKMVEMFKKRGFSVIPKDGNLYAELALA